MTKLRYYRYVLATFCSLITTITFASTTVAMYFTSENNTTKPVGTVIISETPYGLLLTPNLHDLTPGIHGFHIHQNPACDNNGMSAGGHFDPQNTGKHLGPYNENGHYGDLPVLWVNAVGTATLPVLAPRIHHLDDIHAHALMIHSAGDNYADLPEKLGGGGGRMVCGIIN